MENSTAVAMEGNTDDLTFEGAMLDEVLLRIRYVIRQVKDALQQKEKRPASDWQALRRILLALEDLGKELEIASAKNQRYQKERDEQVQTMLVELVAEDEQSPRTPRLDAPAAEDIGNIEAGRLLQLANGAVNWVGCTAINGAPWCR
eukprot:gene4898-5980_t